MYDQYEKHLAAQLYPEVINFCYIITAVSKDNKLDQELAFSKGVELIQSINKNTVAHESSRVNYLAEQAKQAVLAKRQAQQADQVVAQPVAQPEVTQPVTTEQPEVTQPVTTEVTAEPAVAEPAVAEPEVNLPKLPKLPTGFEQSASGIAEVLKQKLTMLEHKKVITKEYKSEIVERIDEFAKANIKNDQPFMKPIEVVYNNLLKLKAEFVDHSKLYDADTEEEIKELSAIYLANHCKLHKGVYPLKIFMASNMNNKASKWYFSLLSPLFVELRDMFNKGVDWEWIPDKDCFKALNDCSFARPYWVTSIYKWIAKDFFAFNELPEITGIEKGPGFLKSKYRIHNVNDIAKQQETNPFVIEELEQFNLLAPLFNLETITVA